MESLSSENQTLVQAAINSVNIQLSASASAAERMNAGKVRDREGRKGEKREKESEEEEEESRMFRGGRGGAGVVKRMRRREEKRKRRLTK